MSVVDEDDDEDVEPRERRIKVLLPLELDVAGRLGQAMLLAWPHARFTYEGEHMVFLVDMNDEPDEALADW